MDLTKEWYLQIHIMLTLVCICSSVAMQYLHFLNAEFRALYPPISWEARLSADTTVRVPLNTSPSPMVTPSCRVKYVCQICIHLNNTLTITMHVPLTFSKVFRSSITGANTSSIPYSWMCWTFTTIRRCIAWSRDLNFGGKFPSV